MAAVALVAVGWASLTAWRDPPDQIEKWRLIKVICTFCGLVGFGILVVSFEQFLRSTEVSDAEKFITKNFLQAKIFLAEGTALFCARASVDPSFNPTCNDMRNFDSSVSFVTLFEGLPFEALVNSRNDQNLDATISQVNYNLNMINEANRGFGMKPMFRNDTRMLLSIFSMLLVLVATTGSVGEAIFQFQQARRDARARRVSQA